MSEIKNTGSFRDINFYIKKIEDIDSKIDKCFEDLNEISSDKKYSMKDNASFIKTEKFDPNEIINLIFKLEKLREFYITQSNQVLN